MEKAFEFCRNSLGEPGQAVNVPFSAGSSMDSRQPRCHKTVGRSGSSLTRMMIHAIPLVDGVIDELDGLLQTFGFLRDAES